MPLRSTRTKQVVNLKIPQITPPVEFPKPFFDVQPGPPTVSIPRLGKTLAELRNIIAKQARDNTLSLTVAKAYLWEAFKTCKGLLKEDWKSFDVEIGPAGAEVTPCNLLAAKMEEVAYTDPGSTQVQDRDDKAIMFLLLGMYRLSKNIMATYRTTLMAKMDNQLDTLQSYGWKFSALQGMCGAWGSDPDYCKLVAAFDMFTNKFSNHPMSGCKMGTVGSRFRDCAALTACHYITETLGITAEEFCDWVYTQPVGREIDRMTTDGQEIDKADSYMPYLIDMGISQKSPYSAQSNPGLHLFIHTIGSLLGTPRSQRARFFTDASVTAITQNAVICAYAFSKVANLGKYFTEDGDEIELEILDEGNTDPSSTDGEEWFYKIGEWGNKVSPHVWEHAKRVAKTIKNPREGTIGEHLSQFLPSQS